MNKKTTIKPIALHYRDVGSANSYVDLMGVLKGLTIAQDDPDSTEVEAEFYDSPFDIFYEGNPVTLTFELTNYELSELPALFGGSYNPGTGASAEEYEAATTAYTSEKEWKLDFQRGYTAIVIYRGLTLGTLKKDADGALNYTVTITALVYTDNLNVDHMYKIVGGSSVTFTAVSTSQTGYSSMNPQTLGWYESDGTNYRLTWDTEPVDGKTYYTKD